MPEINEEVVVDTPTNEEEGKEPKESAETVAIPKADYEKLNQDLGSLKRELKDLKKAKEEPKETSKNQPDDNHLLEKAFLRSAGLTKEKEVELALATAKKWDMGIDKLVDDEDFQIKLDKLRTQESNELATSGVRGGAGTSKAKDTPEYWVAKGVPPTAEEVPDRKTRAKIARALIGATKSTKVFYND